MQDKKKKKQTSTSKPFFFLSKANFIGVDMKSTNLTASDAYFVDKAFPIISLLSYICILNNKVALTKILNSKVKSEREVHKT